MMDIYQAKCEHGEFIFVGCEKCSKINSPKLCNIICIPPTVNIKDKNNLSKK